MAFNFANVAEWEVKVAPVFAALRSSQSTGVNIRRRWRKNRDNGFSILVLPLERGAEEKNATTNTQKRCIHHPTMQPYPGGLVSRLRFHLSLSLSLRNPSIYFLPLLFRATVKEGSKFARARYFQRIQNGTNI